MRFVIDASVAVRWFLEEERHPHSTLVLDRLLAKPELFAVPELFCFEVFAVLQRIHPVSSVYSTTIIPLLQGGMLRYPMTYDLAKRGHAYCSDGLSGYDATYAALAEMLGALWITFDSKAHRLIEARNVSMDLGKELPSFD